MREVTSPPVAPPAKSAEKLTPHILRVMALTSLGTFASLAGSYSFLSWILS